MKITKNLAAIIGLAIFAFAFSSCGGSANNNSVAVNANKSNSANVINSSQSNANDSAPVSNNKSDVVNKSSDNKASAETSPMDDSEMEKIRGQLHLGKSESYIFYVGRESGDFAAFCFANDSDAGRAILSACKNGDQCEFTGTVGEGACQVPNLEADLSASGRITKVVSAKSLGRTK